MSLMKSALGNQAPCCIYLSLQMMGPLDIVIVFRKELHVALYSGVRSICLLFRLDTETFVSGLASLKFRFRLRTFSLLKLTKFHRSRCTKKSIKDRKLNALTSNITLSFFREKRCLPSLAFGNDDQTLLYIKQVSISDLCSNLKKKPPLNAVDTSIKQIVKLGLLDFVRLVPKYHLSEKQKVATVCGMPSLKQCQGQLLLLLCFRSQFYFLVVYLVMSKNPSCIDFALIVANVYCLASFHYQLEKYFYLVFTVLFMFVFENFLSEAAADSPLIVFLFVDTIMVIINSKGECIR
ncbi:hypothetical protein BY458DRAFT_543594 [Sporodiniella umbellata]|nr:hypothetical protein BY458DRAFT_543594 [Sporodiniella umbellata]